MKNQATVEFIVIFMIFLVGILIAAMVSFQKVNEVHQQHVLQETESLLGIITSTLDTVELEGDGFVTVLVLPDQLQGLPYIVTVGSHFVVINVDNQDFTKTTLVNSINGTLQSGENTLRNREGTIDVS